MFRTKKRSKKKLRQDPRSKKKIKRRSRSKNKTRSKKYLDGGFNEEKLKITNYVKTNSNNSKLITELISFLETDKDFTSLQKIEIFNMIKDIINLPEFNQYIINLPEFNQYIKKIIDKIFNEILENIKNYFYDNRRNSETIIYLFNDIENDKDYIPEQKIQIFSELNKTISTDPSLKGLDNFKKIILQKIHKQKGLLELKTKEHIKLLKYKDLLTYTNEFQNALNTNNFKFQDMINSILDSRIDMESKRPYISTAFNILISRFARVDTTYESLPIIEEYIYKILNSKILTDEQIKFNMNAIRNLIEPINYETLLRKHNIILTENDYKFNYLKKILINIGSRAGLTDEELIKLNEIQFKAKL